MRTRTWVIILSLAIFIFISACSAPSKNGPKADNAGDKNAKNAEPSGKDGQSEKNKPEFAINDATGLPEGWRDDIPLMEGMNIIRFNSNQGNMNALLKGNVPIDDVYNFYSDIKGWERDAKQEESLKDDENMKGLVLLKDDKRLTIAMYVSDGITNMNIVVQQLKLISK